MIPDQADELARRARQRSPVGAPTAAASRALRRLRRAGDGGGQEAIDAVWTQWLDDPDDVLWATLSTWRRPTSRGDTHLASLVALDHPSLDVNSARQRAALVDAATRHPHPLAAIARQRILAEANPALTDDVCEAALSHPQLADLCCDHGLEPTDPRRRAVFFLLTDQPDKYHALDPDGSLLTVAYQAASQRERERLRSSPDDADVLRVVAAADRQMQSRRLRRAGDGGDQEAIDAVWAQWLDDPDDVLWAALSRWRRPASRGDARLPSLVALDHPALDVTSRRHRAALIHAATGHRHPLAAIARRRILTTADPALTDKVCEAALTQHGLAELCRTHGLVPADPRRRAVFFLLTDQPDSYRALDPDGSLLAVAYQAATPHERERLRRALTAVGDLDVVRVIVGIEGQAGHSDLTEPERRYLVTSLTNRADWDALWRFAQTLPLADAADAVHHIGGAWQPDGRERHLFRLLADADPQRLAVARRAEAADGHHVIPFDRLAAPHLAALSPDGTRLVVSRRHEHGDQLLAYDVTSGALVESHTCGPIAQVVHESTAYVTRSLQGDHRSLEVFAEGKRRIIEVPGPYPPVLTHHPGGFVVLHLRDHPGGGPTRLGLSFYRDDGARVDEVPLPDFGAVLPDIVASEPRSGRLAVGDQSRIAIFHPETGHVIARATHGSHQLALFVGPEQLITLDGSLSRDPLLCSWAVVDAELVRKATRPTRAPRYVFSAIGLARSSEIVFLDHGRTVRYLDAATLQDVGEPRPLTDHVGLLLASSPGGAHYALVTPTEAQVVLDPGTDPLVALADRPLADTTPADLALLTDGRRRPGPTTRPLFDLLRTYLVHQFETEIRLGTTRPVDAGPHDIALRRDDGGAR